MDLQVECAICKTETFYSCVTCDLPICNRNIEIIQKNNQKKLANARSAKIKVVF